jgi:hypothetical protein
MAEQMRVSSGMVRPKIGRRVPVVDATSISEPASTGTDDGRRSDERLALDQSIDSRYSRGTDATGHPVSDQTGGAVSAADGYWRQWNQKTREGPQPRDRDQQFGYLNRQVASFRKDPVLLVDTKKRELVRPFKNGGRVWRPEGKTSPGQCV